MSLEIQTNENKSEHLLGASASRRQRPRSGLAFYSFLIKLFLIPQNSKIDQTKVILPRYSKRNW